MEIVIRDYFSKNLLFFFFFFCGLSL